MLALAAAIVLGAAPRPAPAETNAPEPPLPAVLAVFEHDLSSATGPPPLTWASISYDRARKEVFVAGEGFVRVFDAIGMEVHRFGEDGALGSVVRAVALDDGDIVVLSSQRGRRVMFRCDYRGEPIARFAITGLPQSLSDFQPDQLVHRNGQLYFAERGTMRVVVADVSGAFRRALDLRRIVAAVLPPDGERRPPSHMDGFGVDAEGNLLFTSSTMFCAGRVSPSGEVRLFGARGSRPGRFNVIGGIDADDDGNIYITDRLRSIVSVWDRKLRHLADFGHRGDDRMGLLSPYEIAAGNGKVFVSQGGDRGVSAFRVRFVEPPPSADQLEPPPPPPPARPAPRPPPSRTPGPPLAGPGRVG